MGLSGTHLILVVGIIVLLFGKGKISDLMGDVGKGIKSFKRGLDDSDQASTLLKQDIAAAERTAGALPARQPQPDEKI